MNPEWIRQLASLQKMSCPELRACWRERFGVPAPKGMTKDVLLDRLSESLEKDTAPTSPRPSRKGGTRIKYFPHPGVVRKCIYKSQLHVVKETERGFEYEGRLYRSYSAIARRMTGWRANGLTMFGITERPHSSRPKI